MSAIRDKWIQAATATDSGLLKVLLSSLHKGEAEAIALAVDLKAEVVIIDEHEGRALATLAGLAVTGVLGICCGRKRAGHIDAVKPEIDALRCQARFFIAAKLELALLSAAGE